MSQQLALSLQLRDDATFENFYPASNQAIVDFMQQFILSIHPSLSTVTKLENCTSFPNIGFSFIYLWGGASCGRSHLLQASCHQVRQHHLSAFYLPLCDHAEFSPDILQGLENLALVAIDDIHLIAGNAAWEEALFHCYNRFQQTQTRLIVSGNAASVSLQLKLADLKSRLGAGISFHIQSLNDDEKLAALQLRARFRGMILPAEVGQYLLRHFPRDMGKLFLLLDDLDRASLAAQSRLTIPFIKNFLG